MAHPPLFSLSSHRFRIGLLLMTGLYVMVSMRLNLSMGVTCMVNSTAFASQEDNINDDLPFVHANPKCQRDAENGTAIKDKGYGGSLLWSPSMQSLLFSATFYGGLVTITISGYFADRFGPKTILLAGTLDYVIMTLLGPLMAENSYWAYFTSRVIIGLGEGFTFPCLNSMATKWFPPTEKSTIAALYTSGNQLAAGLTSFIASGLCTSPLGWPSIFYIFGTAGVVWCILWYIFASNTPGENKWLSVEEKEYLENNVHSGHHKKVFTENSMPFRYLLFSKAALACFFCQFAFNFSATILQSFLPTYFKDVLQIPIHMNGLFTMVPFISQLVFKNVFGILSDFLKRRKILSPTTAVKIFQTTGSIGSAITLALLSWLPSCENPYIALPLLAAHGFFFATGICGFFTSIISIAPPYTGTLSSISMTYATLANIGGPLLLTFIDLLGLPHRFEITFAVASLLNLTTGLLFLFFGSGSPQHWAQLKKQSVENGKKI